MKKLAAHLSAFLIISGLFAAENADFMDKYLSEQIPVEYPYQMTTVHEYYIFAAKKNTPQQLVQLLKDPSKKTNWRKAIHALGVLSANDRYNISLESITRIAKDWESTSVLSEDERLRFLERAYWGIAYQGSEESLEFLKRRTQQDFWEGRVQPTGIYHISHSDRPAKIITARSEAIAAIGKHPLEAAEKYLQEIYKDPEFYESDVLRERLESQFRMRSTWLNGHQKRLRAFEAKHKLEGQSNESVEDPPASVSAPEGKEVAQESPEAEPSTEKPAEVKVPEPAEEPAEEPSQWWLWLIGAVVVFGGLGLMLRRKG